MDTDYKDQQLYINQISERVDPIKQLPVEISLNILSKLQSADRAKVSLASKSWLQLALDKSLQNPEMAFGAKQWYEYFGVKVKEPPLPNNIDEILKSQCPFSDDGKKVEDTHMLTLIPGGFTLKTFGELVKSKFPELGQNGYRFITEAVMECGYKGESHWVLMTKEVLTKSKGKSFYDQQMQIKEEGKGNYQVSEALDVVACAFSEYARSNRATRLFSDELWTYIRCQYETRCGHVIVGGFASNGLLAHDFDSNADIIGVTASRKL